jgi:hypothetical protein
VKDGILLATPFLDVSAITRSPSDGGGDEQGLLGFAFSPSYATDGYFFIYHTDTGGTTNTLARYHVSANPDLADTSTRTSILTVPHPTNTNHNGGDLAFGPDDGFLYLTTGDGGGSCDSPGNAPEHIQPARENAAPRRVDPPYPRCVPHPRGKCRLHREGDLLVGSATRALPFDRQTHDLHRGWGRAWGRRSTSVQRAISAAGQLQVGPFAGVCVCPRRAAPIRLRLILRSTR